MSVCITETSKTGQASRLPGERVNADRLGGGAGGRRDACPALSFSPATEADDSGIRRLLRENPMAGRISLSLEREPDCFTEARHCGAGLQTIVARAADRVVCVGACSFRERFVNGERRRVGYLGGLRLDHSVAGRADILRRGYRFFHELQRAQPADYYFTAIAAGNDRARQFLERNLPGMPRYEYLGDFVTRLVQVPGGRRCEEVDSSVASRPPQAAGGERPSPGAESRPGAEAREHSMAVAGSDVAAPGDGRSPGAGEWKAIALLLEEQGRRGQFAPCWTVEELQGLHPLGLRQDDFRVVRSAGGATACAALWDQRSFKQTVIRAYAAPLAWARPAINLAARLLRRPGLPAAGSTLAQAAVSHLAGPPNEPGLFAGLIRSLFPLARSKRIEWLTLGLAAADPRLAVARVHFAGREYRSRLYRVRWPDLPGESLDDRMPCPELALL